MLIAKLILFVALGVIAVGHLTETVEFWKQNDGMENFGNSVYLTAIISGAAVVLLSTLG